MAMASFDTKQLPGLDELSEQELWGASLKSTALCSGEAFKVMLLALVLARTLMQPCLCPAMHHTDMATAHGLNILASPQTLPRHYRLIWWSGLLAESSCHHRVCSARSLRYYGMRLWGLCPACPAVIPSSNSSSLAGHPYSSCSLAIPLIQRDSLLWQ